jgi:hypothetical protein
MSVDNRHAQKLRQRESVCGSEPVSFVAGYMLNDRTDVIAALGFQSCHEDTVLPSAHRHPLLRAKY